MTAAERVAFRISSNRAIERRVREADGQLGLAQIVARLNERRQRATYGAVAALVGVLPRGLMGGRQKCREYSWVVNAATGRPTDYSEDQIDPACLRQILSSASSVIDDPQILREWLKT